MVTFIRVVEGRDEGAHFVIDDSAITAIADLFEQTQIELRLTCAGGPQEHCMGRF